MSDAQRISAPFLPFGVAIMLLADCGGTPASPSSTRTTFTVSGLITDETAHLGISYARIDIISGSNTGKSTTADANGAYALRNLAADTFHLQVTATGYATVQQPVTVPAALRVDLQLSRIPPVHCGDWPGPNNTLLPFLSSPFFGGRAGGNYFDHDAPYQPGDGYQLTSCGERLPWADGHSGYDWGMPIGTPIFAAAEGRVTFAGNDVPFYCDAVGRVVTDQTYVEVRHTLPNGEQFGSIYVHLSEVDVVLGQSVGRGQQVGLSGNAGCSTSPHLHFQIWRYTGTNNRGRTAVDPYGWEGTGPDPWARNPNGASSAWMWLAEQAPALNLR
jgi:murein DD-endopeptidase MepM/ murein hydrolase activator NlpD